jgi:hypothetical protein
MVALRLSFLLASGAERITRKSEGAFTSRVNRVRLLQRPIQDVLMLVQIRKRDSQQVLFYSHKTLEGQRQIQHESLSLDRIADVPQHAYPSQYSINFRLLQKKRGVV